MPIAYTHTEDTHTLAVWDVTETYRELCLLPPCRPHVEEAERRFSSTARRTEWLAVRALLHAVAGPEARIAYLPSGRPYLTGSDTGISISHTAGHAAILLGRGTVGIDIEQYGPRIRRVAPRILHPSEHPLPYQGDDTWTMLLHWSAKEAAFKCLDRAGIDFQQLLRIAPFTPAPAGRCQLSCLKPGMETDFTVRYRIGEGYVLTYIVASP